MRHALIFFAGIYIGLSVRSAHAPARPLTRTVTVSQPVRVPMTRGEIYRHWVLCGEAMARIAHAAQTERYHP